MMMKTTKMVTITGLLLVLTGCLPAQLVPNQKPVPSPAITTPTPDFEVVAPTPAPVEAPVTEPTQAPQDTTAGTVNLTSTVALLNTLTVTPPTQGNTYDRDRFKHWVTPVPYGCNTRKLILGIHNLNNPTDWCNNDNGTWVSIYDNQTFTDPSKLDIDHMVPLKEAWVSGAYEWTDDRREAYANDFTYENSLLPVSASSNRSKGDRDPANWMPTHMDGCEYVSKWVTVKYRWGLSVDVTEKDKILSVLSWCGGDYPVTALPTKA